MAEEATVPVPAAAVEEILANGDGKKMGAKREYKRDETPIEELFDLSKPLPRVRIL